MFSASSEWLIFVNFCLIRKYTKYSLNLTVGWECNDTPSLNVSNYLQQTQYRTLVYDKSFI